MVCLSPVGYGVFGITLKLRQRPIKLIWLQNLVLEKVRVAKLSAILLLILGKG